MKNKKKKKEENKRIILFIILGFALGLIVGSTLFLMSHFKKKHSEENISGEVLNDEKIAEYLNNNYKLSYLLTGDIKVSEATIKLNDLTYYGLDDPLLEDIRTYEDIENLFKNNYLEGEVKIFLEYLNNENYNRYISFDNKLYVLKRNNPCKKFIEKPSEYKIATMNENEVLVDGSTWGFSIYKNDNKWLMSTLNFKCEE